MTGKKYKESKNFTHFVTILSVINIFEKHGFNENIVSQLLFGETGEVVEKKNKHWYKIKSVRDSVFGWVSTYQIEMISPENFKKFNDNFSLALEVSHPLINENHSIQILMGSQLNCFDGISLFMSNDKYVYNGQAVNPKEINISNELLIKIARRYLYAPYFAGGRSPFGIDSSGLIQNIYSFFNIVLPRSAFEQAGLGEVVDFSVLSKTGDLAFFHDGDGIVNHVGLVLEDQKILHCFGMVRIDKIDHFGIYNKTLKKYTHKLRIIKRILPEI
ncbi:MAG: C40 family peptidase [Saprospiraceae bacterium]|nr:C40 family peptidase [Saprospiraceae bacterium]